MSLFRHFFFLCRPLKTLSIMAQCALLKKRTDRASHLTQSSGSHSRAAARQGHLSVSQCPDDFLRIPHLQPFQRLGPNCVERLVWDEFKNIKKLTVQAAPAIATAMMGLFVTVTSGGFVAWTFVLAGRKTLKILEMTVYSGDRASTDGENCGVNPSSDVLTAL